MTFQELIDNVGIDTVFANTSTDLATQNCILEWFFDYDLCDSDDTTKWMRVFRRRVNDIYPKYLSLVRIMTVKDNMDPFIQVFMEKIHKTTDLKDLTFIESKTDGNSGYVVKTVENDNTRVEADSGKTERSYTDYKEQHSRGEDGITVSDTYDGYHEKTSGMSGGSNIDHTTADESKNYNRTEAITSTGEGRNISISYPEANMGSIPNGVASDAGATSDIAYAQGEGRTFSKSVTPETKAHQNVDSQVESDYGDINSQDKSIVGEHKSTEKGTDTKEILGSYADQKSGGKTTFDTGGQKASDITARQSDGSKMTYSNGGEEGKLEIAEQGRTESPADILPRAVRAIIGSDEIQFLIDGLMPCFDCFGRL